MNQCQIEKAVDSSYEEVSRICQPLFKNTPIKHFDYGRYYDSGEVVMCGTTSPDLVKKYYTEKLCPTFEEFKLFNSFGLNVTFLSHSMPLPPGVYEGNEDRFKKNIENAASWKIFHRLYIVCRASGYFSACGFGVINEGRSVFNFYLNALGVLEKFVKYFEREANELIEKTHENARIILPYYHDKTMRQDEKLEAMFGISNLDFSIQSERKCYFEGKLVTSREAECLELIAQGFTMKTVAKKLEISPRTVEQHLRNMKDKFGLNTKNQLVEIWHEISKI